ncbi:MAG: amino acid permease [Gemmatimonadetes bacterium]|nr:amino acid permease [Gemmatimonadota bacterium]
MDLVTPGTSNAVSGGSLDTEFRRGLGLFDATMMVMGSMIGSSIFIASAEMSRQLGSAGWLLASWAISGVVTVAAALSYGELAGMMPRAGGQYVFLREAFSPVLGFLYGWTLFLVIQAGAIAAVSVGFARYIGILWPWLSEGRYVIPPIHLAKGYAVSLSAVQLAAVLLIAVLTWANTRGLNWGRLIQNSFTTTKTVALIGLILAALTLGWNESVVVGNFGDAWQLRGNQPIAPGITITTTFGLFVTMCVAQVGCLSAFDGWNNVTFAAGEVKHPRRNIPLSLALGAGAVVALYVLANLAYTVTLPLEEIQRAPADRVAAAVLEAIVPHLGAVIMASAIIVSTVGACNGVILAGARVYYVMARDGLFFSPVGRLNGAKVPGWGLVLQGVWSAALVLPRTYNPATGTYGNLYTNLLEYVISAALVFYVLTIAGLFRLRRTRPEAERPYRAWGYPVVPALYIAAAVTILVVLFLYRASTTWPGLLIVLLGLPVYALFRRTKAARS